VNNRKETRVKSRGKVELRRPGGAPVHGVIHDVSESGISVDSGAALKPGEFVEIDCGGLVAEAVVRHCAANGEAFRIGLQLAPNQP
jgi:hypothetical protein